MHKPALGTHNSDLKVVFFDLQIIRISAALSEVKKIYPPLKLSVFVDDITAFENGTNKESVEVAEKVLRKLKKELLEVIDD